MPGPADQRHPFGYGKESYVWAFFAAMFTFVAGAGFAVTHGVTTILVHEHSGDYLVSYIVLAVSFVIESISLARAVRQVRRESRRWRTTPRRFLRLTADTTVKAVFLEDSAALIGLLLAGAGVGLSHATGDEVWDGVASILIGLLLLTVAGILASNNLSLLVGRAVPERLRHEIEQELAGLPEVERIDTLMTMQLGPDDILVAAKVDFRDEATGAADRGRRRRGRAAAHRAVPGDPLRLPRPDPLVAGRHRHRPGTPRPGRSRGPPAAPTPDLTAHPGAGRQARAASVPVMVRWRTGTVATLRRQWTGAVELDVDLPDGTRMRALAYPELVGTPEPGDRVLLNAGALLMGLGTGGYALVVALPDRLPPDPPEVGDTRDAGHLVKARYTPLQPILLGVDEEASPHRDVLADADDLGGLPVVTADLHSALPAILAGIRADAPAGAGGVPAHRRRGAARLVLPHPRRAAGRAGRHDHRRAGVRRRPGGHHPARRSARRPARAAAPTWRSWPRGPGNLGTGTRWGFSGVAVGEAVNAIATLGGRPVGSLRISDADPRPRHRGVSHHSLTAYGRVALAPAELVVPDDLAPALLARGGRGAGAPGGPAPDRPGAHRRSGRRAAGQRRCRCPRWAGASTPTTPTSWPPLPPAGTRDTAPLTSAARAERAERPLRRGRSARASRPR